MKNLFSPILILFILTVSTFSFAQEEGEMEGMDQQAMMEAWQKSMTPGPMHEMMASNVGKWKSEVTMWMDPSQPPTTSVGTSVTESLLGGRYFQTTHTGNFMGMDMTGIELSGYDNVKKEFFSTWIDNFGTGIMYLTGTYDEASKILTYTGTSLDPMGMEYKVRETMNLVDNDTHLFEMYMDQGGQEFKSMEIKFTRIKE